MSLEFAAVLLAELTARGITLRVEGDYLQCRPRSALKSDLVERVRAHKAELLALLRGSDTTDTDRTPAVGSESGVVAESTPLLLYSQAERDLLAGVPPDVWQAVDRFKDLCPGARVIDVSWPPADFTPPTDAPTTPCLSGRTAREIPSVESNLSRARTAKKARQMALNFSPDRASLEAPGTDPGRM